MAASRIVWWFAESAGKDLAAKDAPKRKENVWPLKTYTDQPLTVSERPEWKVKDAIPGLKPGDLVEYLVEVVDNCQPTPNVVRSRQFRLEILSRDEYGRRMVERQKEYYEKMRALADKEREAAERIATENRQGGTSTQPATNP
jgi:hypothetical protein